MAWRRRPDGSGVPEELCRFVASEWPGAGCVHEALLAWEAGCADWLAADSARAPRPGTDADFNRWWVAGGSRRVLPFGEYGDGIDVLREGRHYRRQMPPCAHEYRPAQHWLNGPPERGAAPG